MVDPFDEFTEIARTSNEKLREAIARSEQERKEEDEYLNAWRQVIGFCAHEIPDGESSDKFYGAAGKALLDLAQKLDRRNWQVHIRGCKEVVRGVYEGIESSQSIGKHEKMLELAILELISVPREDPGVLAAKFKKTAVLRRLGCGLPSAAENVRYYIATRHNEATKDRIQANRNQKEQVSNDVNHGSNQTVTLGESGHKTDSQKNYCFKKDGAFFDVCFVGKCGKIDVGLKGAEYVYALLQKPNVAIPATELRGTVRWRNTRESDTADNMESLRECNKKLQELKADLDTPDLPELDREESEAERQQIEAEVRRLTGLGGKPRTSTSEPDRVSVRQCLGTLYRNCRERYGMPRLAEHLELHIKTEGDSYAYRPPGKSAPDWIL